MLAEAECSTHSRRDWALQAGITGLGLTFTIDVCANYAAGLKLAEVGFLLIVIAGIWRHCVGDPELRLHTARIIVAGAALTAAGVLLIIAAHWGHFG